MKITLANEKETEALGAVLWSCLPEKSLVFLQGELGAGKTTLTRGFLRKGGYEGAVKSPTYTLVEEYQLAEKQFYHFDLYRLNDPEELEWVGIADYLAQQCICFIEWPEIAIDFIPEADLLLNLSHLDSGRSIEISGETRLLKNIEICTGKTIT